jgi:hypothetical protein
MYMQRATTKMDISVMRTLTAAACCVSTSNAVAGIQLVLAWNYSPPQLSISVWKVMVAVRDASCVPDPSVAGGDTACSLSGLLLLLLLQRTAVHQ